MLGFGGHWSTRSRRYSTIVTVLRRARVAFAKRRQARHGTPSMLCPQGRRAAVPDRDGEQQAQGRLDERFSLLAVKTAGLDGLRIHDLRHTAVALWIAAGANPKEVAARAGHASVSFTLDRHGHLYPEADLNLRERLDAIWSAAEADRERLRPQRDLTCCGSRHEGRTAR
jgi:integrase